MALRFGKYRHTNFIGEKSTNWNIEIWKKDYADVEADGSVSLYPSAADAREFPNNNAYINFWPGVGNPIPGWAWNAANGGVARHTAGDSDALPYNSETNLLTNGAAYEVTIELASVTAGTVNVKLGTAASSNFSTNGTHTAIVTANGTLLSIDPSSTFAGDVKEITLKKYFLPSVEFSTGGEGFEITWNGEGGTRDREFLGSECRLNYIVQDDTDENFLYNSFSLGYEEYFIRVYKGVVQNSNLWWYGWVQPAFDAIENNPYPYEFNLTATDSYGFWGKSKEEFFSGETEKNASHKLRDILFTISSDMNLKSASFGNLGPVPNNFYWCRTSMDWWSTPHTYNSQDPAVLYFASKGFVSTPTTYNDDGDIVEDSDPFKYKPSDVFKGVLKSFNTVGFLAEGHYNFIQPNNLADNTSGNLTSYEYNSSIVTNPSNPLTTSTLLTIDQSNNVILQGSTINYEPSFERVIVNHKGGFANFNVGSGQDLTSEFYAGSLQAGLDGQLNLSFAAKHYERITKTDFSFTSSDWTVIDSSFLNTSTLTIRITDGSNNRYLVQGATDGSLGWQSSSGSITIERGYAANQSNPINDASNMCVGLVSNPIPTNSSGNTFGPCNANGFETTSAIASFHTNILFQSIIDYPDISGDIYIQLTANNNYYQADKGSASGTVPFSYDWTFANLNDPTPVSETLTCENITLVPTENNDENDVSNGIVYTASQTNNTSIEVFDMGDVNLGQSTVNQLYSFQYNSGTSGSPIYKVAPGFRRGNSGAYKNASQLLANEYLQLQVEPLEILQADIQSANISPLRLVKYSINNDGSYKYYSFLGGSFKAKSEILSGEWYKVKSVTTNITEETTSDGPDPQTPTTPSGDLVSQGTLVGKQMLYNNSYGQTNAPLTNGSTYNKVNFGSTIRGTIKDNQKLLFTYPDGTNPLVLTADGGNSTSESGIDVDSFTLKISYPIGSILSPLLYDFTNVITPTPNLYEGITTTAIYIASNEFVVTTTSSVIMYTRDNIGSVQPSSYVNRSKAYATSFIPLGYKVTDVDVYSSVNGNIGVLTGRHTDDTTTSKGTGTANTTFTLSSPWTSVEGDYLIISFEFGASTDEIYGAKITISSV
tara:strand:- start:1097 stop:4417 length:3321 start_codon:yes stop_codon:yes gene_type:complete